MTRSRGIHRFAGTRHGRAPGAFLLLLVAMLAMALPGAAQDTFVRTTPIDGEILDRWPRAAVASFPESIDPDASSMRLVDINGEPVDGVALDFLADRVSLSLALPSGIPDGVYSLVWHATTTGGETIVGYSSFSVGNPEDAAILTIPTTGGAEGPPQWLQTGARWSALVGTLATVAVWPIWTLLVRPSIAPAWRLGARFVPAMQQFAFIAFSLAFLGSLLEVAVHSQTMPEGTWLDKLMNTIGYSDWGAWWLLRMILLVFLGIGLALVAWWFPRHRPVRMSAAWALSLLVPWPLSMTTHAADDSVGQVTAVASNYLHALASALWVGGAVIIATVVLPNLRGAGEPRGRETMGRLATRFGGLTIVAWVLLAITGAYAAWLYAGSWTALAETAYGSALLVKLALALAALILVVAGMAVVRRLTRTESASTRSRLRWLLLAQGALALVVLVAAGTMTTTRTARDIITEQSRQRAFDVALGDRDSRYLIAPGRAGVNHLRLEIPGNYIPNDARAYVTISSPDHPEIGTKTFQMYRVPGNAFEHHGTEFALIGTWDVSLRFVEPGFDDRTYQFSHHLAEDVDAPDLPSYAWKFETLGGTSGLVLILIGLTGIVIALFTTSGPTRKEAGGLGTAALVLAVVVLMQAWIDPILAVSEGEGAIDPNDLAMVARGRDLYDTYCINCHGANLRGDGPLNENLNPPASDFAAPHTFVHSDADLIFWIQNGKQGTAMPGFDAQLSDQDMRDVVAFIQNWQQDYLESGEEGAAPAASTVGCEVAPISFSQIPEIFHHGLMPDIPRGTPLIQGVNAAVDGDTANEVMWSVEQIVACTNEDLTLSRLRLFSKPLLMELFPTGADQRLTTATTSQPRPLGPGDQVAIEDVQSITRLADGRVAVSVIFSDPAGVGVVPGAGVITQVTLVMLEQDGAWIVDEIR
jgi:copper transport protein